MLILFFIANDENYVILSICACYPPMHFLAQNLILYTIDAEPPLLERAPGGSHLGGPPSRGARIFRKKGKRK